MSTLIILVVLLLLVIPPAAGLPGVPALLSLGLQLLCSLPRTRRLRGWWLVAGQAALFAWMGPVPFGGPSAFFAASVLLVARGPLRWVLFGGVTAAAGVVNLGSDAYLWVNAVGNTATQGLVVFALTRLSDLRDELHATRAELAARSVAEERERAGHDLDAMLGSTLSRVIGLAAAGRAGEIPPLTRRAAQRVRQRPGPPATHPAGPPPGDLTPRLALPILTVVYLWFPVAAIIVIARAPVPVGLRVAYWGAVVAVVVLQAYHALPRPPGARPRQAAWTLPAQLLLAWLPLLEPDRPYYQLVGWAAAALLIVIPAPRPAWALYAVVVASVPAVLFARSGSASGVPAALVEVVGMSAMFYGLHAVGRLVHQVRESRLALAGLAAARERRRIAQDVHDLIGYSLSAITVKAELATRDPARSGTELAGVVTVARAALADLRAIPGDGEPGLGLRAELASAREVLEAAGAAVEIDADRPPLLPEADALLAVVVREAVTNVLRHSRARHVTIALSARDDLVRLRVDNDGVTGDPAEPGHGVTGDPTEPGQAVSGGPAGPGQDVTGGPAEHGQGVANLTTRLAARGGRLTTASRDRRFRLDVTLPMGPPVVVAEREH
ncbi:histidine kinase [Nonomuraea sp. NPDC005650]|uniref:sensor histidine kinase n=1 Tax=Nonomuraea sp. NPDC005650 TaxID=3157045 RepID=UPI00339E3563